MQQAIIMTFMVVAFFLTMTLPAGTYSVSVLLPSAQAHVS